MRFSAETSSNVAGSATAKQITPSNKQLPNLEEKMKPADLCKIYIICAWNAQRGHKFRDPQQQQEANIWHLMLLTHCSSGSERIQRKPTNKQQINYSKEENSFSWAFLELFPIVSKLAEREVLSPKLSFEFKFSLVWDWKDSFCLHELDWKIQTPPVLTFLFFLKCYKEKKKSNMKI